MFPWKNSRIIIGIYFTQDLKTERWGKNGDLVMMVQQASALLFSEKEEAIPVPRDHSEIAKFASQSDHGYDELVGHLKNFRRTTYQEKKAKRMS